MQDGRFAFCLGPERQLLVDRLLIEETDHLQPVLHQPKKHPANPLIQPDIEGENLRAHGYGTLLFDARENLFKARYLTGSRQIAYATSADGLNWEKPSLPGALRQPRTRNAVYSALEDDTLPPDIWGGGQFFGDDRYGTPRSSIQSTRLPEDHQINREKQRGGA